MANIEKEKSFHSLSEFIDFAKAITSEEAHHVDSSPSEWSGGCTWNESLDLLENGHKAGLVKISKSVDKLHHETEAIQPTYQWADNGQFFDVGEMLTGSPEHWLDIEPEKERKVYKILVHVGMLATVDSQTIENRGASLIALIDKLQSDASNIVELRLVSYSKGVGQDYNIRINIDMGTSPLDMDSVSYALAHPAFFRMLIFGAREKIVGRKTYSMGHTEQVKHDEDTIYFHGGSKDYYSKMNRDFSSLDTSASWVNKEVKTLVNKFKDFFKF